MLEKCNKDWTVVLNNIKGESAKSESIHLLLKGSLRPFLMEMKLLVSCKQELQLSLENEMQLNEPLPSQLLKFSL